MIKRLPKHLAKLLLPLLVFTLVAIPVFAAYSAQLTTSESASTDYDMIGISVASNNQWMSDNFFFSPSALDTRVETLGGSAKPWMVAQDRTLTAIPVPAQSQTNLYFTTDNSDLASMDIISGYDGYYTILDDTTLEPLASFEFEHAGYVDTGAGSDKNLVSKAGAYKTYISGEEEITSEAVVLPNEVFSTVSTTADEYTVWLPVQRQAFYANGRHWVFYSDNVNGQWRTSLNGAAWSAATQFRAGIDSGDMFSIWFDGTYVHYCYWDGAANTPIYYRRGTPNAAGTITWSAVEQTALAAGGATIHYYYPYVSVDTSGYVYITYTLLESGGVTYYPYVTKSGNTDGTWGATPGGFPYQLNATNDSDWRTSIITLTADKMLAVYGTANAVTKLRVQSWNGAAWNAEATSPTAPSYRYHSTIAEGDNARIIYLADPGTNSIIDGQYTYSTNTLSETVVTALAGGYYPVLTKGAGGVLYCFWANHTLDHVYYLRYDGTVWDSTPTDWVDESVDDLTAADKLSSYYEENSGEVGLVYSTKLGAPFNIQFALLQPQLPISVTAPGVTAGGHTVKTTYDGADLTIIVDEGLAGEISDTTPWVGAVVNTGSDWLIGQNNVVPYLDFYKHIVSGVEHAWYQPNYMVENTGYEGTETAGGSDTIVTDDTMTDIPGYWEGARVVITDAGDAAPEGETAICTSFAAGGVITVSPAFSANVDIGDDFTLDFGTLVDRSCYGLDFDAAGDEVVVTDAASIQNVWDGGGTLALWTNVTSDGENNQGRIADKAAWYARVDNEAAGLVKVTFWYDFDGVTDGTWVTDDTVLTIGDWDNLVITYNADAVANNPIFYVNGTALTVGDGLTESTIPVGTRVTDVASDLYIGDEAGGTHCYDGVMDEVWLYSAVLTQDNVTADYNSGDGSYVPDTTTGLELELHIETGTGAVATDTSGNANNGAITNASWATGYVERTPGLAGTNDARITWGAMPTGVTVTLGGMVSSGQPSIGAVADAPARDLLPEITTSDWYVDPALATLATNPFRPFVTIMSDTTTLTELQAWRLLGFAFVLIVTVGAARAIPRHLGIAGVAAGIAVLLLVVLTVFPPLALVLTVVFFIGGWMLERTPSMG